MFAAIVFPVLIAGMALGTEAGYWYFTQRKLQHAADLSAHAAGTRKKAGDVRSKIDAAALFIAQSSGFDPGTGKIAVNSPAKSGPAATDMKSIEVILTETEPLFFSSAFRTDPVTLQGRAVVTLTPGALACVLALSTTASGSVTVSGSSVVKINGCDVATNSKANDSFVMQSGGRLTTDCVHTVGGAITSPYLTMQKCGSVDEQAAPTEDPYAGIAAPAVTGTCQNGKVTSANFIPVETHPSGVKAMRFCGGIDIKGTVNFGPGLYIVDGGSFTVNASAVVSGTGVTFYMVNGAAVKFNGSARVNVSAPTSGPYSGLLFFGDRNNVVSGNTINGSSGSTFDGAIYFQSSGVDFSGGAGSAITGCTQIVAKTVNFSGTADVTSNCQALGTRDIVTTWNVTFVE